jgi:hypothetical protein
MTFKLVLMGALMSFAITACTESPDPPALADSAPPAVSPTPTDSTDASPAEPSAHNPLVVTVYKNESCGCCKAWVAHLRENGFRVEAHDIDNLGPVKKRVGIPFGKGSCHTAEVGGYFVEGHVPAAEIRRLLSERPDARGLAVPGMPIGSPGMETPGRAAQAYDVLLVARDGSTSVFSRHGEQSRPDVSMSNP